ncbi:MULTISPECIES: GrpB family protein [Rhizobium]|uniref:Conserved protein n=1 Tax=Rhizobium favelukesii TaxID=348824 RepID=W6R4W1_9HYPH|nr:MULTISPECIES: GrpB family protein [Rhizobium]MCA0804128.1 GrpB family protein [Rhizobium sp. T1473]MCS0460022.1 GrpB family protein [Rhizobium favelukesii]UFS82333.1 GrpB family protein [Rhizobium sp. T136]CDM55974.1 putative conserved protein [Rhizobium favelukesii]
MRPVRVVDYDPKWPDLFEAARAELLDLAADRILAIEHIGSTSVPGLAAKPKIDLDAVLANETALAELGALLPSAGFRDHGDPQGEGRWTFTRDHDCYGLRLYLCTSGNPAHRDRLLFRDYLRLDPDRAAEYQSLKRHLAKEADGDWDVYTDGKSDFVAETLRLAKAETELPRG